jgi:hypothetical protein
VIGSLVGYHAGRFPTPFENRVEKEEIGEATDAAQSGPSTLKALVGILPETKLLRAGEQQDLWVAIEIRCGLHNRQVHSDPHIDMVFIIDNG